MATVLFRTFALCIVGLAVLHATFAGIIVTNLETTNDNDYVGVIKSDLKPVGRATSISLTVPLLKDLDDSFQVKVGVYFVGTSAWKSFVTPLCDVIKESFFTPVFDNLEPKEKLPLKCPITAGEWKLVDLIMIPSDYIPFAYEMEIEIAKPDKPPVVKIKLEGFVV